MFRQIAIAAGALFVVGSAITAGTLFFGQSETRECRGSAVGATIGGPFALTDHNGQPFTDKDLVGAPSLLYFGFAYCPDICPTELSDIALATDILEEEYGMKAQPVFITVDPERDTVERMSEFAPYFHERMIGLTGSLEATTAAAKAYRVYFNKTPASDFPEGYTIDHSSYIYLLDDQGRFTNFYRFGDTPEQVAEDTACHLGASKLGS